MRVWEGRGRGRWEGQREEWTHLLVHEALYQLYLDVDCYDLSVFSSDFMRQSVALFSIFMIDLL